MKAALPADGAARLEVIRLALEVRKYWSLETLALPDEERDMPMLLEHRRAWEAGCRLLEAIQVGETVAPTATSG